VKACVADASVVAKLFFEEEHSDRSAALLRRSPRVLAPDLVWAELANVVWKRTRRAEITDAQANLIFSEAMRLPIEIVPIDVLIVEALDLAMVTRRSVYDCLYLTLAIRKECPLVTADRRLANALAAGPFARQVRWIGGRL
jgi:predicted nucleic acid-binding protein